jgi:hypothetical protein
MDEMQEFFLHTIIGWRHHLDLLYLEKAAARTTTDSSSSSSVPTTLMAYGETKQFPQKI